MIASLVARLVRAPAGRSVSRFLATSSIRRQSVPAPDEKVADDKNDVGPSENAFMHSVLRNSSRYDLNFIRDSHSRILAECSADGNGNVEWKKLGDRRLCREFAQASLEAYKNGYAMSDDRYVEMFAVLNERAANMTDEELKNVLVSLLLWRSVCSSHQPEFHELTVSVDKALIPKAKFLSNEKTLQLFEIFYQLRLLKRSDFVYAGIKRLNKRVHVMSPEHLVLYLFYLNILRSAGKALDFFDIEDRLAAVVDKLTIEELGIACAGFFKTERYLHIEGLIDTIVTKMIQNADTAPEITLVCIMKALRYKLPTKLWHRLPEMIDALVPQIDRLSMRGAIHVPLILSSSLTRNERALDRIACKLLAEIDDARLKDMEKVVYPCALTNYSPKTAECIFDAVARQLDREERLDEIVSYPRCYIAIVHYFVVRGVFLANHIDRILSMEFLRKVYGKSNYVLGREALFIDASVELECPNYTGNRLPVDIRNYMSKRYSGFIPDRTRKLTYHQKFEVELMDTLKRLTGDQYASLYLLPNHSKADHVVRWDSKGGFPPLPEAFVRTERFSGLVRPPGPDYVAVVPVSRNMCLRTGSGEMMGEYAVKIRQLRTLGYRPVVAIQSRWPADGTDSQKEDHLFDLIKSSPY